MDEGTEDTGEFKLNFLCVLCERSFTSQNSMNKHEIL